LFLIVSPNKDSEEQFSVYAMEFVLVKIHAGGGVPGKTKVHFSRKGPVENIIVNEIQNGKRKR
jgi:hypothetical protein